MGVPPFSSSIFIGCSVKDSPSSSWGFPDSWKPPYIKVFSCRFPLQPILGIRCLKIVDHQILTSFHLIVQFQEWIFLSWSPLPNVVAATLGVVFLQHCLTLQDSCFVLTITSYTCCSSSIMRRSIISLMITSESGNCAFIHEMKLQMILEDKQYPATGVPRSIFLDPPCCLDNQLAKVCPTFGKFVQKCQSNGNGNHMKPYHHVGIRLGCVE